MKSIKTGSEGNGVSSEGTEEAAAAPAEPIDFSKVEIEPLFKDFVDFETFSKSDFRAVKVLECEAVPKSKKLLKFGLDDGTDQNRVILSGIHAFYEPEQLIGKTLIAIINLPPRAMMAALRKQKPWGCFHLTANVQRAVKPRWRDRNGLIIMLVLSAKRRKNKNKSYEKRKTKQKKNTK